MNNTNTEHPISNRPRKKAKQQLPPVPPPNLPPKKPTEKQVTDAAASFVRLNNTLDSHETVIDESVKKKWKEDTNLRGLTNIGLTTSNILLVNVGQDSILYGRRTINQKFIQAKIIHNNCSETLVKMGEGLRVLAPTIGNLHVGGSSCHKGGSNFYSSNDPAKSSSSSSSSPSFPSTIASFLEECTLQSTNVDKSSIYYTKGWCHFCEDSENPLSWCLCGTWQDGEAVSNLESMILPPREIDGTTDQCPEFIDVAKDTTCRIVNVVNVHNSLSKLTVIKRHKADPKVGSHLWCRDVNGCLIGVGVGTVCNSDNNALQKHMPQPIQKGRVRLIVDCRGHPRNWKAMGCVHGTWEGKGRLEIQHVEEVYHNETSQTTHASGWAYHPNGSGEEVEVHFEENDKELFLFLLLQIFFCEKQGTRRVYTIEDLAEFAWVDYNVIQFSTNTFP